MWIKTSNNSNCSNNATNPIFTANPRFPRLYLPPRLRAPPYPPHPPPRSRPILRFKPICQNHKDGSAPLHIGHFIDRSGMELAAANAVSSLLNPKSFQCLFIQLSSGLFPQRGWIIEAGRRTRIGAWSNGERLASWCKCFQVCSLFEISIDIDGYQSSTNAFDPLKLLAVLIRRSCSANRCSYESDSKKIPIWEKRPLYPIAVYVSLKLPSVLIE